MTRERAEALKELFTHQAKVHEQEHPDRSPLKKAISAARLKLELADVEALVTERTT